MEKEESVQSPADMEVDEIDQALDSDQETRSAKKRKRSDDDSNKDGSDLISPGDDGDATKRLKVCVVHLPETFANGGDAGEILSQVLAQDVLSAEDTSIVRNILERRQSIDESSIRQGHAPTTDAPSEIDAFHISADEITHISELSPPNQTRSRSSSLALVIIPSRHSHVGPNENQENRVERQDSSRSVLDCAVCHADVDFSEPGSYCILPCRHAYHQACIKPWFQTQVNYHNDIDCPRCRRVIPYDRRSTLGIGEAGIQRREEGHDLPQPLAQQPSEVVPTAENAESNFLVDNDLLPSPAPLRTERQIIDDFFVRLQRRNWDPTTKVIISTVLLALNGGLIVGGFGGALLGALIALLWRYNLGHRVLSRLVGEILSTAFVIGSDILPPTHWAARTLRFLLISSVFLGHLSVMHAISRAAGSSDDVFTQTASYVNIIMVLIMFTGRLHSKLARLLASAVLQFVLAYVMIFSLRNLSIWEDLFFGFAQHLVFVAVRHP